MAAANSRCLGARSHIRLREVWLRPEHPTQPDAVTSWDRT